MALRAVVPVLCVVMAMLSVGHGARVVSGQTVCMGGREEPCYKIAYFRDMSSRVAFWEARQACEIDGGSLLSIESATEQKNIEHLLQELRTGASGSSGSGGGIADGDFWIGLTRSEPGDQGDQNLPEETNSYPSCPDIYYWTDSSVATFRNWYFDEPSCGGEACVVMYHQPTALPGLGGAYLYQWNDDRCNMKHNFICKYEPESHLVKEHADRPVVRGTEPSVETETERQPGGKEESSTHVVMAGSSGMLLVYVIIPTIPLILLILVASGTCCFQMFSKSKPPTKTSIDPPSTLWISKGPKAESMEV
ncbi:hypothetical protein NHX12_021470 [Muraenolepis orangiensis]|uniref:C-type lectin domain-containing protein n=1 Tax=Muraenolepis orangiensis TaxID=630683 RepID=A0A9Q0IV70_9TELE|nr:hypothetical protein NHX12_021470 [Muraenolepis orangiensis]